MRNGQSLVRPSRFIASPTTSGEGSVSPNASFSAFQCPASESRSVHRWTDIILGVLPSGGNSRHSARPARIICHLPAISLAIDLGNGRDSDAGGFDAAVATSADTEAVISFTGAGANTVGQRCSRKG